ncbi:Metal-dependent hydrolase, endonuclease/exonuclease/phosphatase family [Chitinophaga costaii]|uniref:Metal-dependent hydrolase, endonuclease/exonuclease/phosphatase family n=1 Tax=Chitinophaga costaii TaxID=1335309 RepID=A0A1C4CU66_9BACT|nr:endonuclease/exonuclease/phosphatase family protein [Chitinophaga costaii]PUZ27285.1 endonuclease [Chitinophaga costaii]SCC22610.1 Metal-dependent hydrolase, endonuclease/exonuclease/phosphatase family [Chitinophaga costaii]
MKKSFWISLVCVIFGWQAAGAQQFTVGTYNLRNDNKEDVNNGNGWQQRYPVIAHLLRFHGFDIFGTQEGLKHQLDNLKDSLQGFDYIGVGRDDGKDGGEHSAIFYDTRKFKVTQKGDFWLSEIEDRPNKGWDAVLPRICSWGLFKEIKTGYTFYMFNLHMDHIGVKARAESAKLILKKIKDMTHGRPVILTGDFNVDQTSESYQLLATSGVLFDAYETTLFRYALTGSFNGYKPNLVTNSRIDHIFLTKDFTVQRYGILDDTYRSKEGDTGTVRMPSDHFPVLADVTHGK